MKRIITAALVATLSFACSALAEEIKLVGPINKVEVKGSTATVEVKDNTSGKNVTVKVTDQLTVDKLNEKKIAAGDEVRIKYESSTGITKLLRKTAGC